MYSNIHDVRKSGEGLQVSMIMLSCGQQSLAKYMQIVKECISVCIHNISGAEEEMRQVLGSEIKPNNKLGRYFRFLFL